MVDDEACAILPGPTPKPPDGNTCYEYAHYEGCVDGEDIEKHET